MKTLILFALFATLMVTVYAARLPRDDKIAASDMLNGGEAETRSKFNDFTKQVSGTFTKYFNDGKSSLSSLVDKAENQFKNLRKSASQSVSKAVDSVRQTISGPKIKPLETPKIENPITALGN